MTPSQCGELIQCYELVLLVVAGIGFVALCVLLAWLLR